MLESLYHFTVIVEQKSLNRAAAKLNISQPALSRKLAKLEQELDVELFERKGKKLELTRMGQVAFEYASEFKHLERKFRFALDEYKNENIASLTIGASLTTLQSTLPDLISLLTNNSLSVDIKTMTGKTHEIVSLVKEKQVDIGLVASKISEPGITCIPLFDDHLRLVLPSSHLLSSYSFISIEQLNEFPMILFSKGTWYRIMMDELFHKYEIIPDIKMEIDSFEAILRLVSTSKLATLLPQSYLRPHSLEDNGLIAIDIKELRQTVRTTSLIYTDWQELNRTSKELIDMAIQFF